MLSFNELIKLNKQELEKELANARGLDNNEFWRFTRLSNPQIQPMIDSNMYYRKCKLVNKYYDYINKPIQVESNNCLNFSHRLNTYEKVQTLDRIMYKERENGNIPKIIIL